MTSSDDCKSPSGRGSYRPYVATLALIYGALWLVLAIDPVDRKDWALENALVVAFGMPYQTLMPVFAERVYEAGASGLGLLLAASGVGALAGAVAVAGAAELKRPALVQVGLAVGLGAALIAFSLTRWFPLALGLMVFIGFLFAAFSALNNTLLMSNTEPHLTGRVMSVYLMNATILRAMDHRAAPDARHLTPRRRPS